MTHIRTDPACILHRPPRTAWGRWRFKRGRGRGCRVCVLGWSLSDLLRHRHATCEFGHCHLRMSQRTFDATRNVGPAVRQREPREAKLDELLGLSVVVDAAVPDGSWHLAENAKPHRVVHAGRVSE
jgi:hypothetical protein